MEERNLVCVALFGVGRLAIVGYFADAQDLPHGWRLSTQPRRDLSDIMAKRQCSKEEALRHVNSHWQR